ncbi:uncharacterized protein [Nicotiana tomentosiformis]|uniref:uncharacterized protein n=1 Tax=Nicotiana tomentosiformis TaxID=4098 RepID=UPI00388CD3C2
MPETTITPTGDMSNAVKPVSYDVNHPYHLNNSDSPGMTLVDTVFNGRGYPGWRISILLSLLAKKKLGFINGACQSPDHEQWSCVNDMVISWILNALSKDIADSKELSSLVQGNNDIAAYFTKLKRRWDELDALNVIICRSCICVFEGKVKLTKSFEVQRLIQFLMGLNDIYAQARGNILMMNPLPSIDVAYSLLLQDENQREVYANAHFNSESVSFMAAREAKQPNAQLLTDFAAFMITGQGKNYQKLRRPTQRGAGISPKYNNSGQKFVKLQQSFKGKKKYNPNVFCTYCGKTGHTQEVPQSMCFDPNSFLFLTPLPVPLNISLPNSFKGLLMKSPQVFGEVKEGLYLLKPCSLKSKGIFSSNVPSIPKERNVISESVSFSCQVQVNGTLDVKLWQFNVKIRMIRSDNALELGKGTQEVAFLASEGILHQLSCVATPQQNRIVERKHRHLLEIARGLMFQSKLHMSYWGESILTATHLINRMSSSVLKGKTLYEVLFQEKPKYDHLRNFGCLCYDSTIAQGRGKFDDRATTCGLLGYPLYQKGYKLLELSTGRVFVSRDVKFHEAHFPFVETSTSQHPIFPSSIFTTRPTYSPSSQDQSSPISLELEVCDIFSLPSPSSSFTPSHHQ